MTNFLNSMQPHVLVLSPQEREFLERYGDWLERLELGLILPTTERQVRFLSVIRGERKPEHPNEDLWLRVKATRESIKIREKAESEKESLANRLAIKGALIEKLNHELEKQKKELEWQKSLITKLQRIADKYEPIQPEPVDKKKTTYDICHQCGGDGGAGGRCPRCGGNGFEP